MTKTSRAEQTIGQGGLPLVRIETPWSVAEIYLQGATVTHFQKHGEAPLLFLSALSRFEKDAAIRGGEIHARAFRWRMFRAMKTALSRPRSSAL